MDCEAELIKVKDFSVFCKQQFFEEPSSDGGLWFHAEDVFNRQTYVMYVGCNMQGNFGDEHFILHRPSEFIDILKNQMIYGNVVFSKIEPNEWYDKYIDMSEEEAKAISDCFSDLGPLGIGKIEVFDYEKAIENS